MAESNGSLPPLFDFRMSCEGADHGFTVDDLRTASVSLGVVGITVGGQRYVSLPSHAKQLEPWAQYHASVVRYHRSEAEKEW